MTPTLHERLRRSIDEAKSRLVDLDALGHTMQHLVQEGAITEQTASSFACALPGQLKGSRYILSNLGAHLAIGVIFAFDLLPLPLGTIARVSWVAGARLVEVFRRNRGRARIHSAGVLVLAAIPWFGYAAYLLPLRRESGELAFVLANHSWLARTGRSYEDFLGRSSYPLRRLGRWLIPLPIPKTASPVA
ncbi:MAG: hypothetical protein H8E45_07080 [Proteobacteria bacterium]|nr:hypothetical protein [Pseudomonadota bacterium]